MTLQDFFSENAKLSAEWAADLNTDLPSDLLPSSHKKVWWRCEKGHEWQAMVFSRTQNGTNCPYCSGHKVIPGETDLISLRPDIAKQWDYEQNCDVDPQSVTAFSHKKVWWRCEKGHSWQATIVSRTKNGSGCPFCSGLRVIPGETDLETLRPDITKQWDYERNGDITPQNVSVYSHKKVWWRCEKGHSWLAMVHARTKIGTGCPVCAGRKLAIHI